MDEIRTEVQKLFALVTPIELNYQKALEDLAVENVKPHKLKVRMVFGIIFGIVCTEALYMTHPETFYKRMFIFYIFLAVTLTVISYLQLKETKNKISDAQKVMDKCLLDTQNIDSPIPPKYRFTYAIECMLNLIDTHRANSWGELYDKTDEAVHRWMVENANQEMLDESRKQTKHLKKAERNTAISATMSIAQFIFKS